MRFWRGVAGCVCASLIASCIPELAEFERLEDVEMGANPVGLTISAPRPDNRIATTSDIVPYGEIAVNCSASPAQMGAVVANGAGYFVHDPAPGSTRPRTMFITGFEDGCARQVTAALALFGDLATYEAVRFGPSGRTLPRLRTDQTYRELAAWNCGVPQGQPCGAQLSNFASRTIFLTLYQRFGTSPVWANVLLYRGEVAAMDVGRL